MRRIKTAPIRYRWPLGLVGCLIVSGTIGMHSGRSLALSTTDTETAEVADEVPKVDSAYLPVPRYAASWSPFLVRESYTIRPGETLLMVATKFNTDMETLENLNPELELDSIVPGTVLTVVPNFRGLAYEVAEGDTVEGVASQFDMPPIDIVTFNDVGGELEPGSVLLLPGVRPRLPENLVASRSGTRRTEEAQAAAAIVPEPTPLPSPEPTPEPAPAPPPPPPPAEPAPPASDGEWVWPVRRVLLFSEYGQRGGHFHAGLDMAAPTGTPVYAARSGTVVFAGWNGGYGYCIDIDHGDGVKTRYAHASSLSVSVGEWVSAGQEIMLIGNTGNSTGPHLHFEVIVNGQAQNPRAYLP